MEYQVPQFIEVEDKIFGPLTLKQFIYLAGGVGICAISFFTLPFIIAVLISLPMGGLSLALAFYKMNGKPFVEIMEAAFNYYTTNRKFYWRKDNKRVDLESPQIKPAAPLTPVGKSLSSRKLHELAWSLDVKDLSAKAEEENI